MSPVGDAIPPLNGGHMVMGVRVIPAGWPPSRVRAAANIGSSDRVARHEKTRDHATERTASITQTPSEGPQQVPAGRRSRVRAVSDTSAGVHENGEALGRPIEIAPNGQSGGANTSHTIVVAALETLLEAVPPHANHQIYRDAVLEGNILGKRTAGARKRTFRYLKELYLLRPDSLLFRALRDLWSLDPKGRPLLAGLCSLARDPVFRASSAAVLESSPGDTLTSIDLAAAVDNRFPDSYRDATLAKIGRNTFSSWEQTGHLARGERSTKVRTRASCRPADVAYALLLGHLEGVRGQPLFETLWAQALDQPTSHLVDLAATASQLGLVEFRRGGGVVDVSFHELLRPFGSEQAVLT